MTKTLAKPKGLWSHYYLHQQLMMVQLVLRRHPAGIKHYHLPAKVVITYGHRHGLGVTSTTRIYVSKKYISRLKDQL